METSELLKKVRRIEIKTKGLSNHIFQGEYNSAFKGRGMSFSEVRNYQYGDDVRNIDWNVTARTTDPYVKVFEEERELTVMLMIDISGSAFFGTQNQYKKDILTEIAATLAFSASKSNDKVGLILFSNEIELYIPPKKGKKHILRLIREIIDTKPKGKGTDIDMALKYLSKIQKKKTISFLLSDYIDDNYKDALALIGKRHDLVGIRVQDPLEQELPNVGLIKVQDAETGQQVWLDTSRKKVRQQYLDYFAKNDHYFEQAFLKSGTNQVTINTNESYVNALLNFFKNRH